MSDHDEGTKDFFRVLAAYFLPPVGVYLQTGFSAALAINCVLTLLFWLPGTIHAVWVISTQDSSGRAQEGGNRTFLAHLFGAVFPPAGVFLKTGLSIHLLINFVLLWFFWLPAMVHAAWIVCQPDPKS